MTSTVEFWAVMRHHSVLYVLHLGKTQYWMTTEVKVKEQMLDESHDYRSGRDRRRDGRQGRQAALRLTIRVGLPFCALAPGLQRHKKMN